MWMVNPYTPAEIRFRRAFIAATAGLGAVIAAIFLAFPDIDLSVSRSLRVCPGAGYWAPWCSGDATIEFLRDLFIGLTVLIGIAIFAGLARTLRERRCWFGLAQARWWFLFVALGVGPGLVANVILKDNWGRARPRMVVEFGGKKQFTPPLLFAQECRRNCSFVSGEVSSASVPFFAAALLLPQLRVALLASGVGMGLAAGLIRISQGGHFLSDVLFACIFMALTASALHVLLIGLWQRRGLDEALAPYARPLQDALAPYLRPLQAALAPRLRTAQSVLAPYVSASERALVPYLRSLQGSLGRRVRRLQEAWANVSAPRAANLGMQQLARLESAIRQR